MRNVAPINPDRRYVLYWMTAQRRLAWNHALDRAVELANELDRPLLVFEALRAGYRWACDRHHAFVMEGMRDNRAECKSAGVAYHGYVEPSHGAGRGLLAALADQACVVVGDDFPCFFLPRMTDAVAARLPVRFETVDSNGVVPLTATPKAYVRAFDFRRWFQREGRAFLEEAPQPAPLAALQNTATADVPAVVRKDWPTAEQCADVAIDHTVKPVPGTGGRVRGRERLDDFVRERLDAYDENRNQPSLDATSGLSPYLHYGHVGGHEAVAALLAHCDWSADKLGADARGSREGWWGLSGSAEAFLDQLVTWRELGFHYCHHQPDYNEFDTLPEFALKTLAEHAGDKRDPVYTPAELEAAETHDELWNAAQRQLMRTGVIHNYLRMLWGKKVLEWSATPQEALGTLIHLNNKYALDGRDPNSYSGIFWCFGRFDRAWGPERPIFGKVRYMSSANTARKLRVKPYLERYAGPDPA